MPTQTKPWVRCADGLAVTVRLTPKGGRDAIEGVAYLADGRSVLKARVRAAPSDGEANRALQHLLRQALGVALHQVELVGGATSRIKRMMITGDIGAAVAVLERFAGDPGT